MRWRRRESDSEQHTEDLDAAVNAVRSSRKERTSVEWRAIEAIRVARHLMEEREQDTFTLLVESALIGKTRKRPRAKPPE